MQNRPQWMCCLALLLFTCGISAQIHDPIGHEVSAEMISSLRSGLPFSFVYGGQPANEILPSWRRSEKVQRLAGGRIRQSISYLDPATHLEVIRKITVYPESDAIEWLLTLRNRGTRDTPILERILPLDLNVPTPKADAIIFHSAYGSNNSNLDYAPVDRELGPSATISTSHFDLHASTSESSECGPIDCAVSYLPFFNLQWPSGGLVGAIGWTGQWVLNITRSDAGVKIESGQETTHFRLHAGESSRTPSILFVVWRGSDRFVGQNALRRLLISYYLPRIGGRVAMPPVSHSGAFAGEFDDIAAKMHKNPLAVLPTLALQARRDGGFMSAGDSLNAVTEKNQIELIRQLPQIGLEAYWLDAGWMVGGWPGGRGSWVANKNFPDGLAPLADEAHKQNLKFILWFEPDGVSAGNMIAKEHPEWVLNIPSKPADWRGEFRWDNADAEKWMVALMAKRIREWRVNVFRMDNNVNPLPFWQIADSPDRQGIAEIRQTEGLYALWDTLRRNFPNLIIDNANWRITGPDIEAMRRTIGSLTRSEVTNDLPKPALDQAHTAELSMWIPLSANLLNAATPYDFRSTATTGVAITLDLHSPYVPVEVLRKGIVELKSLRPFWLGDYFPLTEITSDEKAWCGWQFHRQDLNAGFALLFRRSKSPLSIYIAQLREIDPKAYYDVSLRLDYEAKIRRTILGADLTHLAVDIPDAPGSLLVRYRKVSHH